MVRLRQCMQQNSALESWEEWNCIHVYLRSGSKSCSLYMRRTRKTKINFERFQEKWSLSSRLSLAQRRMISVQKNALLFEEVALNIISFFSLPTPYRSDVCMRVRVILGGQLKSTEQLSKQLRGFITPDITKRQEANHRFVMNTLWSIRCFPHLDIIILSAHLA